MQLLQNIKRKYVNVSSLCKFLELDIFLSVIFCKLDYTLLITLYLLIWIYLYNLRYSVPSRLITYPLRCTTIMHSFIITISYRAKLKRKTGKTLDCISGQCARTVKIQIWIIGLYADVFPLYFEDIVLQKRAEYFVSIYSSLHYDTEW